MFLCIWALSKGYPLSLDTDRNVFGFVLHLEVKHSNRGWVTIDSDLRFFVVFSVSWQLQDVVELIMATCF
jgi:hypothetical protein